MTLLTIMNDGTLINVEVQNRMNPYMFKQFQHYAMGVAQKTLQQGQSYHVVQPVISIIISNGTPFTLL